MLVIIIWMYFYVQINLLQIPSWTYFMILLSFHIKIHFVLEHLSSESAMFSPNYNTCKCDVETMVWQFARFLFTILSRKVLFWEKKRSGRRRKSTAIITSCPSLSVWEVLLWVGISSHLTTSQLSSISRSIACYSFLCLSFPSDFTSNQ